MDVIVKELKAAGLVGIPQ